jgi:hypothetical protein
MGSPQKRGEQQGFRDLTTHFNKSLILLHKQDPVLENHGKIDNKFIGGNISPIIAAVLQQLWMTFFSH